MRQSHNYKQIKWQKIPIPTLPSAHHLQIPTSKRNCQCQRNWHQCHHNLKNFVVQWNEQQCLNLKNGPMHVINKTEDSINWNYSLRYNWALIVYSTSKRRFTTYFSTTVQWLHLKKSINYNTILQNYRSSDHLLTSWSSTMVLLFLQLCMIATTLDWATSLIPSMTQTIISSTLVKTINRA